MPSGTEQILKSTAKWVSDKIHYIPTRELYESGTVDEGKLAKLNRATGPLHLTHKIAIRSLELGMANCFEISMITALKLALDLNLCEDDLRKICVVSYRAAQLRQYSRAPTDCIAAINYYHSGDDHMFVTYSDGKTCWDIDPWRKDHQNSVMLSSERIVKWTHIYNTNMADQSYKRKLGSDDPAFDALSRDKIYGSICISDVICFDIWLKNEELKNSPHKKRDFFNYVIQRIIQEGFCFKNKLKAEQIIRFAITCSITKHQFVRNKKTTKLHDAFYQAFQQIYAMPENSSVKDVLDDILYRGEAHPGTRSPRTTSRRGFPALFQKSIKEPITQDDKGHHNGSSSAETCQVSSFSGTESFAS